jgi:hypothetical protein
MMVTNAVWSVLEVNCKEAVPPFWLAEGGCYLSLLRRCWRALCIGRVYSQPDNWLGLTLGLGLERCMGDSTLIRLAALVVAVVARVLETTQHYKHLIASITSLKQASKGHYVIPQPCAWQKELSEDRWLSPSTKLWWRTFSQWQRIYWWHIGKNSCKVARFGLELTSTLAELADALSWEPATNQRNVREVFVNIDRIIEHFVADTPALIVQLRAHSPTVAVILKAFKAPFKAGQLIEAVETVALTVKVAADYFAPLKQKYGEEIGEVFKKGIVGAAAGIGCLEYIPQTLVPKKMQRSEPKLYLPYQPLEEPVATHHIKSTAKDVSKESTRDRKDKKSIETDPFCNFKTPSSAAKVWRKEPREFFVKKVVQNCCIS